MEFKGVEEAKHAKGVLVLDAQFVESVAKDGGVGLLLCDHDPQHVVYGGCAVRGLHPDFLGGDEVHDGISCLGAG